MTFAHVPFLSFIRRRAIYSVPQHCKATQLNSITQSRIKLFALDDQQRRAVPFNFVDEAGENAWINVHKSDGFVLDGFIGVTFEF